MSNGENAGGEGWLSGISKHSTAIVTILGFFWGVHTYTVQSNKELEQQRISLSNTFREQRLAVYLDAVDLASTLATMPPGSEDWQKARISFARSYWGKLSVVEDSGVRDAAVGFANALGRCFVAQQSQRPSRSGKVVPERLDPATDAGSVECVKCLRILALGLSLRARESVAVDWQQDLPERKFKVLDDCTKWAGGLEKGD